MTFDPVTQPEDFLRHLFRSAVDAADPMRVVPSALPPRPKGRVVVIGAGKGSARMAEAVEEHWGPCEGLVITRYGHGRPTRQVEIVEAGHPTPDAAGAAATERMLDLVADLTDDDFVLALISGGGSALLTAPARGISLADKQTLNKALLASGMPIGDINGIRKEISAVKGGRLAVASYPARMLALMISDVPGDDPGDIASGPTVGFAGDAARASETLAAWAITPPPAVTKFLRAGGDPVQPDDPRLSRVENRVVAAPSQSLATAAEIARTAGVEVQILGDSLEGEARELARHHADKALEIQSKLTDSSKAQLLLSGGECTVTGPGPGIGGPNAEYVLTAALALNARPAIHVLSCDTDGIDGAAEVAGAIAGPETLARAADAKADATAALANHDAHNFFDAIGGQVVTGPTLTNVNDFRAILILPRVAE